MLLNFTKTVPKMSVFKDPQLIYRKEWCFSILFSCSVSKVQSVLGSNKCTEVWLNDVDMWQYVEVEYVVNVELYKCKKFLFTDHFSYFILHPLHKSDIFPVRFGQPFVVKPARHTLTCVNTSVLLLSLFTDRPVAARHQSSSCAPLRV